MSPKPTQNLALDDLWLGQLINSCLGNKCIYMNKDLVEFSLEIVDGAILHFSKELDCCIDDNVHTILHFIAKSQAFNSAKRNNKTCLSYLGKIVDRFPRRMLSIRDLNSRTPCEVIKWNLVNDEYYKYKQALEIFESR